MAIKWKRTRYPGVRFREHSKRKHGIMPDKYFAIRYQHNGKRKEEGLGWATGGWTAAKAFNLLSELKASAKTGAGPKRLAEKRRLADEERKQKELVLRRKKRADITFDELFSQYKSSVESRLANWYNYQYRYDVHIKPIFGDLPARNITIDKLKNFKIQLQEKGLALATVRHILGVMRQTFNWGADAEVFTGKSPFSGGEGKQLIPKMSKLNNSRKRVLSNEEEPLLMAELSKRSPDAHDMALVSIYSGLRYMEIAQLRWLDIDFSQDQITVIGKGNKERTVPMHKIVREVLLHRCPYVAPSNLVFPNAKGNVQKKISNTYPKAVEALGLNNGIDDRRYFVTFHTLRHTYATRLAELGTPLTVLRDLLGHRDLEMVSRYAKSTMEQAAARVARL